MAGRPKTRAKLEAEQAQDAALDLATTRTTDIPPRTEPADYSDDLIPELIALSSRGFSPVEVIAHWSIDQETWGQWQDAHPAFSRAVRRARACEQAWWMTSARVAVETNNNRYPAGVWSHVMRARFPEFADAVTVNVDLSRQLVLIDARSTPGLMGDQTVESQNPLIINGSVRLLDGQTAQDGGSDAPGPPPRSAAEAPPLGENRAADHPDMGPAPEFPSPPPITPETDR